MKGGWEEKDKRERERESKPISPPFPVYTAHGAERENSYTPRLYRLYVLKRKSNLSCHLSLFGKILDESSPRGGVFIDVIPGERARRPLRPFFSTTSLPPVPPALPRRFRPSIKSHFKRSCYKSIESGKKYNKKNKKKKEKGKGTRDNGGPRERLRPKKHIKDTPPRRRENRTVSVDRPRNSRAERDSPLLSVIVRAELAPFFRK